MKRNLSIDTLKGILIIGVVFIHCGSYVVGRDNFTTLYSYLFSLSSLIVPAFFIISGYFFRKSSNREKSTLNLMKTYLMYSFGIVIFEIVFLGIVYDFSTIDLLLLGNNVGFFWFVNSLLYYMILFLCVEKVRKKLDGITILLILLLLLNFLNLLQLQHINDKDVLSIMYFASGYLLYGTLEKKTSCWFGFIILLYPFFVNLNYVEVGIITLIFAFALVNLFFQFEFGNNIFSRWSNSTLKILAVHYYIVIRFRDMDFGSLVNYNYFIIFLIVISITLFIVACMNVIQKLIAHLIDRGARSDGC